MNQQWTAEDMPDQSGRVAIVTGGNSGIGYEAARALARKGAEVILAVRNTEKGEAAQQQIQAELPSASVELMTLDLSDLSNVQAFAQVFLRRHHSLDLLVNNAGVMATPCIQTKDGFELQFGTNHLGHFALTAHLLPTLLATPGARVVTVSSSVHRRGKINFDNLDGSDGYSRWGAYGQSKLANLLFAYELQRRLAGLDTELISVACHPGFTATNLQASGIMMDGGPVHERVIKTVNRLFAQESSMGALPTLYAATAPEMHGGEYVGPNGFMQIRGYPALERSSSRSYDEADARRLWEVSEALTDVAYTF
jgi:NAD(P)-dependent dehydrogenase (short-subunit alcohol dehydrogenase family)